MDDGSNSVSIVWQLQTHFFLLFIQSISKEYEMIITVDSVHKVRRHRM